MMRVNPQRRTKSTTTKAPGRTSPFIANSYMMWRVRAVKRQNRVKECRITESLRNDNEGCEATDVLSIDRRVHENIFSYWFEHLHACSRVDLALNIHLYFERLSKNAGKNLKEDKYTFLQLGKRFLFRLYKEIIHISEL